MKADRGRVLFLLLALGVAACSTPVVSTAPTVVVQPSPTQLPVTGVWAVHIIAALDRLQSVRNSPASVGQWAQDEVDWMAQNGRAAAIHAGPQPFRDYFQGVSDVLEAGIVEADTDAIVTRLAALRAELATYAVGQDPKF